MEAAYAQPLNPSNSSSVELGARQAQEAEVLARMSRRRVFRALFWVSTIPVTLITIIWLSGHANDAVWTVADVLQAVILLSWLLSAHRVRTARAKLLTMLLPDDPVPLPPDAKLLRPCPHGGHGVAHCRHAPWLPYMNVDDLTYFQTPACSVCAHPLTDRPTGFWFLPAVEGYACVRGCPWVICPACTKKWVEDAYASGETQQRRVLATTAVPGRAAAAANRSRADS